MKHLLVRLVAFLALFGAALSPGPGAAQEDYNRALKRAYYLLNGVLPTDGDFANYAAGREQYRRGVRVLIEDDHFYDAVLRYHERVLGVGLPQEYLEDLQRDDIDGKQNKFAAISCAKAPGARGKFRCEWKDNGRGSNQAQCPSGWEEPVTAFWRPGMVVWVCPSVARACGSDLSKCFIEYENEAEARNSELGSSEIFDSRFSVIKSLSRQPAGIATAVVVENFPYTKILAPGITAVDGAIAHFYRQKHHFDLGKLHLPAAVQEQVSSIKLADTRYRLIYTGASYESAGLLSTFGWLRRYEKNRTRANQTYERLLCRKFTSELPRVFPQDPGNLRTTPGCMGCHATLDPLADFFAVWGEGGDLYQGGAAAREASFAGKSGRYLSDLSGIITGDESFATCTVQNVWDWMMGRKFYQSEADLRAALTQYFISTNYSFKELVFALATHPAFTSGKRIDATVTDPLEQPALGKVPDAGKRECPTGVTYAADVAPKISLCTACHNGSPRQPLTNETQWRTWGNQAVGMMASGNMPPGQSGPPANGPVFELKEAVRCWLEQNP